LPGDIRTFLNKSMNELIEHTIRHLNEEPDDGEQEVLNEIISLRTGVIAGFLAKTKQYANRIDNEVRNLKSDAASLRRSKTPEETNKHLADAIENIGNLFYLQRKMQMYDALTSASTGVGIDKSTKLLLKMEKQKSRR
jgi:hypothetical protein